jgi:hypothetical protein
MCFKTILSLMPKFRLNTAKNRLNSKSNENLLGFIEEERNIQIPKNVNLKILCKKTEL